MRIAYVEDNPTNQALVARVASMNHHIIVSYSEGEIARAELMEEKFDLILMDVELAGEINGLQVVKHLREAGLKTPIVAVTAYAMMGDRDKCLEAGCDDYLPKPLPITSLLELLDRYDKLAIKGESAAPSVTISAPPTVPVTPTANGNSSTPVSSVASSTPAPDATVSAPPSVPTAPVVPPADTTTPDVPTVASVPTDKVETSAPNTTVVQTPKAPDAPVPAPPVPVKQTEPLVPLVNDKTPKDKEMAEPPVSNNGAVAPKPPGEG